MIPSIEQKKKNYATKGKKNNSLSGENTINRNRLRDNPEVGTIRDFRRATKTTVHEVKENS